MISDPCGNQSQENLYPYQRNQEENAVKHSSPHQHEREDVYKRQYIMYIIKRGNYNPVIGIAAVSCVPTTAKVAQKIVSKDNPDSFILGDALGANISGVITSAIITGFYITVLSSRFPRFFVLLFR